MDCPDTVSGQRCCWIFFRFSVLQETLMKFQSPQLQKSQRQIFGKENPTIWWLNTSKGNLFFKVFFNHGKFILQENVIILRGVFFAVMPACYPPSSPLLYVSVRGSSVLLRLTPSFTRPQGSQPGSDDTAAEMSEAIIILVNPPLSIICFLCVNIF